MDRFRQSVFLVAIGCVLVRGIMRCEFRNYLVPEQTYYIYSPGYPRNFSSEIRCRWIVTSPPGFVCRLNCSEIVLTESASCFADRLLVSNDGDPLLMTPNAYCGRRSITQVSTGRRLALSLLTSRWTPGGRLLCEVTAEKETLFYPASISGFWKNRWSQ